MMVLNQHYATISVLLNLESLLNQIRVNTMIGNCLCGHVEFEIKVESPKLYQCHCSLCRKQSGTSSNAATFVNQNQFSWVKGQDGISSFTKHTGFRSDFCSHCGSPVPNPLGDSGLFWVPAGLLGTDQDQQIVAHLYMDSKVCWDVTAIDGKQYDEMPELAALNQLLNPTKG